MRITGLGHAGMFIETRGGSILCDPVIGPTFFGAWFPFPDNRGLDWATYGNADFLYISHRHRDHFDPALMERFVPKDIKVLLPDYPTDDLEQDLRALGYSNIIHTQAGVPLEFGDLKVMVTPLRAPSDGPIGDSSLSVDDGTASILNQNDSHPLDLDALLGFSKPDAYFTQVSGAIWWPMVYDLPQEAKQNFARLKRDAQNKRAMYYIEKVGAEHVFPMAGPPMFLREELFRYNGYGLEDDSIFTDQRQFLEHMAQLRPEQKGYLYLPGTVVELDHGQIAVTQTLYTDDEIEHIFGDKWAYLAEQRDSRQDEVAREEASRAAVLPPAEMLAALKEWWEPLLRRGRIFRDGVGGPVRYTIGELDMVVDFPKAKVREYAGEETGYWFTIPADLVSTNIRDHEIDWSNSIFLSMQFQAGRVGKFNEFIYTFMKCLSRDRIEYVENWYAEQSDVSEDVQLGDWVVQRRCPHLRADLSKTGKIEDGVLTCSLHDWKWDLASGKCLTTHGHPIRSRTAEDALSREATAPAVA
ncbi:Rieske 2Fe-2S domain-containing protein [Microbacterium sp. zg.B48]|uniref:Rieske 2Fe-2S domain-containing protein n=1 Tax=unclassified Microbacterium TaxID=2609290 RepID=UPI00214AC0CE|nr:MULTISPECIES: Rieske 2Fe-2S domain-containing protein [unclassified Microbacterium]MCR2762005.1 Rieske 2Fe-2S domain-containing protein [Microbacterium sp. zg.B48]MCR2811036.1 Rieske 2Fe-2S domain-containing protein [Microbacterium sp. zg.B185]WIM17710.1 Rieske 2Fe-2S domain-containing protein [Microbacterium sp. zg-B185]